MPNKPFIDPVKLTAKFDTFIKNEPVQSGQTKSIFTPKGRALSLLSYKVATGKHLEFIQKLDGPERYIFADHWTAPPITLAAPFSTWLKKDTGNFNGDIAPAAKLPADRRLHLPIQSSLILKSVEPTENKNYVRVELLNDQSWLTLYDQHKHWLAFVSHVEINGASFDAQGSADVRAIANAVGGRSKPLDPCSGPTIKLPGFEEPFYLNAPIIRDGNFTWSEATRGGARIPVSKSVVESIVRVARVMEDVRAKLGHRPITINSWYRDPVSNRKAGGASRSRHLTGDAVDFVVKGIHPYDVYDKLNTWWGDRGGLASATVFTHIDMRGYRARWTYGF